jgi:hypothetical protein
MTQIAYRVPPALLLYSLALFGYGSLNAQSLATLPDCPATDDEVTIAALPPEDKVFYPESLSVSVTNGIIRLVVDSYGDYFNLSTPAYARVGKLPRGAYRIELYIREGRGPQPPGPEVFAAARSFDVVDDPPPCAAEKLSVVGPSFHVAQVGMPYSSNPKLRTLDAHGNPVSNVQVRFERFPQTGVRDPELPPLPDTSPALSSAVSGADGFVALPILAANSAPGTFQYRVLFDRAGVRYEQYLVFANRTAAVDAPLVPVVEYFSYRLLHAFMTADESEMRKLDEQPSKDWGRTGNVFLAYAKNSVGAIEGIAPVCRFYGRPAGLDSHFFSAAVTECAEVQQRFSDTWLLESSNAFAIFLPDTTTGACRASTQPIYRGFNNRPDANHRYALSAAEAVTPPAYPMGSPAWTLEGYGPGVVMCAPL